MRGMFRRTLVLMAAVGLGVWSGCEWESGEDADLGTSPGANVSGVYNASAPGMPILVVNSAGSKTSTVIGNGSSGSYSFSGSLKTPIRPGSVSVYAKLATLGDMETFTEVTIPDASNTADTVVLVSNKGKQGTLNYVTGRVTVDFSDMVTGDVVAEYVAGDTGGSGSIYSITLMQAGGTLSGVDSSGGRFEGKIYGPQTDSQSQTGTGSDVVEQRVGLSYPFTMKSTDGRGVEIVGSIKVAVVAVYNQVVKEDAGNVSVEYQKLTEKNSLSMEGTWIQGGYTASISAVGPSNQEVEFLDSADIRIWI